MKFVYPEFLYALFALLIPVIVHLFNFRRFKKINFSNVKFLEEVQLETQSKSRIKHLLVLFSRLLALAALVLAFCLPYWPVDDQQQIAGKKAISIYVDNSFSMNGENEQGLLIEQSKEMARDVARTYEESDRFQLLTNDFEGRHQRMVSREEFIEYVDEVKPTAQVKEISKVVQRMKEALAREDIVNKRGFILSDLQKSICDFNAIENDSSYFFNVVPIQQEDIANVFIDSVWFKVPVRQLNGNEELFVRVINQSDRELNNLGLKLMVNGTQKSLGTITIAANSSETSSLFFTNEQPGVKQCKVSISDYPITFDDNFYLSYDVSENINILRIGARNSAVKSVYGEDDFFKYQESNGSSVDYSLFTSLDLIVLDGLEKVSSGLSQELKKFAEGGGSIVILPGSSVNIGSYNECLLNLGANRISSISEKESKVTDINLDNFFYDGVFEQMPNNIDLPIVKKYLLFSGQSLSREEQLLGLNTGGSFLSQYPVGSGKLFLFSSGISKDMGNLSRHAIFVTSMLRIAELSNGRQILFQTIGENQAIKIKSSPNTSEDPYHIISENFDVIPSFQNYGGGTEVFVHEQIVQDGNYTLVKGEDEITGIAFNYSRKESDLRFETAVSISDKLKENGLSSFKIIEAKDGITSSFTSLTEGTKLWKWFVIFALIFLLIEVLLLRFL
ncbi:MAG: hypothetical protein ACI8U0_000920 [Flavobacteriales bacterium]|jgi:hypothetical protein